MGIGPGGERSLAGRVAPPSAAGRERGVHFRGDGQHRAPRSSTPDRLASAPAVATPTPAYFAVSPTFQGARSRPASIWGSSAPWPPRGDAVNAYNDGPAACWRRAVQHCELKPRRPRLALAPGESAEHFHRTLPLPVGAPPTSSPSQAHRSALGSRRDHLGLPSSFLGIPRRRGICSSTRTSTSGLARTNIRGPGGGAGDHLETTRLSAMVEARRAPTTEIVFVESAIDSRYSLREEVRWVEALAARDHASPSRPSPHQLSPSRLCHLGYRGPGRRLAPRPRRRWRPRGPRARARPFATSSKTSGARLRCCRSSPACSAWASRGWTFDLCVRPAQPPACISLDACLPSGRRSSSITPAARHPWRTAA